MALKADPAAVLAAFEQLPLGQGGRPLRVTLQRFVEAHFCPAGRYTCLPPRPLDNLRTVLKHLC